jgi:hypothetical protein
VLFYGDHPMVPHRTRLLHVLSSLHGKESKSFGNISSSFIDDNEEKQ